MKNQKLTKKERATRVIARGEVSNHSHVIVGDATIERNSNGEIIMEVNGEDVILRHILESNWLNGEEKWSEEHLDIPIPKESEMEIGHVIGRQGDIAIEKTGKNTYKFIQQIEYDPYQDIIREVRD